MTEYKKSLRRRVVVTGLGVVAANGSNIAEFTASLRAGIKGIKPVERFATTDYRNRQAGVVSESSLSPDEQALPLGRIELLAITACREAIADAEIEFSAEKAYRAAVTVGTSLGGWDNYILAMRSDLSGELQDGSESVRAIINVPYCLLASRISKAFGIKGGTATTVTACAAGANSIARGIDMIRLGRVDCVLSLGADPICELPYSGFNVLQALSTGNCSPYDRDREGMVVGEGAGALVLEELNHARARGARIYCELPGYGLSSDAYHATRPDPDAGGACRAIRRAFVDASIEPDSIDYINGHGTATKHNDLMELKAMEIIFGDQAKNVPISSIKAMIGHTLGAAGAIEAVATILALHHGFLPPTLHFNEPVPGYEYDFVPEPRSAQNARVMISNSFGFGGNAACLIFNKLDLQAVPAGA